MAQFEAKEFLFSEINNGQRYQNGDIVDAEAINKPIEAAVYAQEKAKHAEQVADNALQKINDVVLGEVTLSAYPIGSIYMTNEAVDPAELFGGQWERIKDRFLLAAGDTYAAGATGGSANAVVVSHYHGDIIWENGDLKVASKTASPGTGASGVDLTYNTANVSSWSLKTSAVGESGTGKNMPPYKVVNVWHRYA